MLKKTCMPLLVFLLLAMIASPLCMATPETTVNVDPKEVNVKVGQSFTVNVSITNVSQLRGFDFCLSYDPAILEFTELEEGAFLKNHGQTFMINLTTKGLVWLAVVLYHPQGQDISANGSGVLASITFKAVKVGESLLDLHSLNPCRSNEVKLAKGCEVEAIPNVAFDGRVIVSTNPNPNPNPPPPDPPLDPPAEKSPDVNGDGKVNIWDVAIVARAFGSYPGHAKWDERADLNNDEKVDIQDLSIVAAHFGTSL